MASETSTQAWESYGQFTVPELGKEDPDGRATLYLAGWQAGAQAQAERVAALETALRELVEANREVYRVVLWPSLEAELKAGDRLEAALAQARVLLAETEPADAP